MSDLAMRIAAAAAGGADSSNQTGMGPGDGHMDEDVDVLPEDDYTPSGDEEASEGDSSDGGDGDQEEDTDHRSDERVTRGGERGQASSVSRLVRNVSIKERELAEERQARRQDQARIRELEAQVGAIGSGDPADAVDALERFVMRSIGAKDPSDPRVLRALQDHIEELTAYAYAEGADGVPDLKAKRERLLRERQDRERFRSYDEKLRRMDQERETAQAQAQVAGLKSAASQYLSSNAERTPLLQAAAEAEGFDPADVVLQAALAGVRSGEYPDPKDMRDLGRLYGVIASNLEAHYVRVAEKLGARAGKSAPVIVDNGPPRRVPQGKGAAVGARRNATSATRGGGGRANGATDDRTDRSSGDREDLATRLARAERQARRGR